MASQLAIPRVSEGATRGEACWRYTIEDLLQAGVRLSLEQIELLGLDSDYSGVMVAWALPDPSFWTDVDQMPAAKLDFGWRPTAPVLAEVDWGAFDEVTWRYGSDWLTFPSLPVRLHVSDMVDWGYSLEGDLAFARIWDVLPVSELVAQGVYDSFASTWCHSSYSTVRDLFLAHNKVGNFDPCMLAQRYAGPVTSHLHVVDPPDQAFAPRCVDGERIYAKLMQEMVDENGEILPFEFEPYIAEPNTDFAWYDLSSTSRVAAEQALFVTAPWNRDRLRDKERQAGRPWS